MSRSRGWVTLAVIAAFVAFLLWTTLSAQRAECEVCVEYDGRRNCATASGDSNEEALRTAQTTACGPIAPGMNASIACMNRPPVRQQCR